MGFAGVITLRLLSWNIVKIMCVYVYVVWGGGPPAVTKVLRRGQQAKAAGRALGSSGECLKVLLVADLKTGERSTHTAWLLP